MKLRLESGDCRDVMLDLAVSGETFDACVTDPPYDLTSVVKRFGGENAAPAQRGTDGLFARASRGFMGKTWDGTGVAFDPATWRAVYDVLKPGAHLLAFGGTRTFHRMAVAIEDAGFEIRDTMMWMYGTGFPKSHDVSKGIDKVAGAVRSEVVGSKLGRPGMSKDGSNQRNGFDDAFGGDAHGGMSSDILAPATPEAAAWSGWGTALKPAWEPIIVARKPLIGTVAANVLAHGTGALNIDACRVSMSGTDAADIAARIGGFNNTQSIGGDGCLGGGKTMDRAANYDASKGRWPANVLHDGSDEVEAAFAVYGERKGFSGGGRREGLARDGVTFNAIGNGGEVRYHGDSGTAARFFYSAKAGKNDRAGSKHPTVKPIALMRYLCRLVTPPGGTVLDPFGGSGSTLQAAAEEGFSATMIEREPEYQADILRRIAALEMLS